MPLFVRIWPGWNLGSRSIGKKSRNGSAGFGLRRSGATPRRPIADILIGAFALNRRGLVTRNGADFRRWYPKLAVRQS